MIDQTIMSNNGIIGKIRLKHRYHPKFNISTTKYDIFFNRLMMSVRNIVIRFGMIKLSMVLILSCVIVSLAIYLILAFLTGISVRAAGIVISTLTPLVMVPIFCITILQERLLANLAAGVIIQK
jgi:FlaA1/EpsC-like NDP-sugar epimerase